MRDQKPERRCVGGPGGSRESERGRRNWLAAVTVCYRDSITHRLLLI